MSTNWTEIALTLVILFGFGVAYALVVRHMAQRGVEGQTAYLVVFGVGMTVLISSALVGWQAVALLLACFAASGLPMVIEYVLRVELERKRDRDDAAKIARDLL
jgi:hypothetical protein